MSLELNDPIAATFTDHLYAKASALTFQTLRWGARALGRPIDEARTGRLPPAAAPLLWCHGASAGEMAAALNLTRILHAGGLSFTPGYTTTNRAGLEYLSRHAGAGSVTSLAPWDSPSWLGRAFDLWRPQALFLVETEIWPALILEARRRGVPVAIVSGRIYPRDVRRYRWARPLLGRTFARLTAVLAQDDTEMRRFVELGVPADRCSVAGNLKHAGLGPVPELEPLRARLGLAAGEPLVVFGSLHDDELELAFEALRALESPVRAVIAPRHRSGVRTALAEARRLGWPVSTWSDGGRGRWRLLILDTVGVLPDAYRVASVAVIGGSFGGHGGHSLFEAVRAGAPVLFGPHHEHVEGEARALLDETPEALVASAGALGRALSSWLSEPSRREAALRAQRAALPDPDTIAERYRSLLSPLLAGLAPRSAKSVTERPFE